jgi:hypothetical protein
LAALPAQALPFDLDAALGHYANARKDLGDLAIGSRS